MLPSQEKTRRLLSRRPRIRSLLQVWPSWNSSLHLPHSSMVVKLHLQRQHVSTQKSVRPDLKSGIPHRTSFSPVLFSDRSNSAVDCHVCMMEIHIFYSSSAESAETQDQMKGPSPPQVAPKQSDSTESTFNPVKSAFPLGTPLPLPFPSPLPLSPSTALLLVCHHAI